MTEGKSLLRCKMTRRRKLIVLLISCCSVIAIFWMKFSIILSLFDRPIFMNSSEMEVTNYQGIPLIIHQTWKNKDVPEKWKKAQKSWKNQSAGFIIGQKSFAFIYLFWDDAMLDRFIKDNFPWFYRTYTEYEYNIQRADVARYFLLYYYGGIYSDLDVACKPGAIQKILNRLSHSQKVVLMETKPEGVSNDVMIAEKRHPFMQHVILGLKSAKTSYLLPYFTVLLTTGPIYLTKKFRLYEDKFQIQILNNTLYTKQYFKHYEGSSWHKSDGKIIWYLYVKRYSILPFLGISILIVILIRGFKMSIYSKTFLSKKSYL